MGDDVVITGVIKMEKLLSSLRILSGMLISLLTLSGCVVQQPVEPNDPYYAPVLKTIPESQKPKNGSLFSPNGSIALFDDGKASRIGDIITVVLSESTTSSKSSNVEITKENETDVLPGGGTLLGTTPSLGEFALNSSITADRDFKGEAEADQSNQLRGSISVTVVDIFPNGTLVVRGEKWITLNRGNEFIRISGLVRPSDVSPDNTVVSTKIANARITYSGTGSLADSQQMGWLARFFNSAIWPF